MGARIRPAAEIRADLQERIGAEELGVDAAQLGEAGSRTEVRSLNDPPARGDTTKIDDNGSAPEKIVEFLVQRRIV